MNGSPTNTRRCAAYTTGWGFLTGRRSNSLTARTRSTVSERLSFLTGISSCAANDPDGWEGQRRLQGERVAKPRNREKSCEAQERGLACAAPDSTAVSLFC